MNIAVVILNWNGKQLLEQFLPGVIAHSPQAKIYLVDNASNDDSVLYVEKNFPQVTCIVHPENYAYAKGYNKALTQIQADVYCLLNSDVEVTENWLLPVIKHFENQPDTAIIQPKILDYNKREYFEYAGAAGGFIDALGYPYCRGRIFDTLEKDTGQYDDDIDVDWASGACLFIRSEVFRALGGFDEDYFAHQEEIDLCWRAFGEGYRIRFVHESMVYHVGGASLNPLNPQKTYLNFRNSLYNLLKNASYPFGKILLRLLLDGWAGLYFLIQGKPVHTLAVIRAHFSFYYHSGRIYGKRKTTNKKKKYSGVGSIVYRYFIRGEKTFRELNK